MKEYDQVGSKYRKTRSPDIGVADVLSLIEQFGRKISVLDLGCGNGFPIAVAAHRHASHYVGIDSSKVLAEEFTSNVLGAEILIASMDEVDLGGRKFDFVFGFGSVFHLPPEKQRKALRKAAEVVELNGVLMFTSSRENGYCTGNVAGVAVPHWSLGEDGYVELLESCGLSYKGWKMASGGNCMFIFNKKSANKSSKPDAEKHAAS